MNIRCAFCQTPYTLSRVAMLDALQEMDAGNLTHYDAHCPRCKRATPIPRQRLEMAMPKWRDELKKFEAELKAHPQQAAPASDAVAAGESKSQPAPEPKTSTKPKPATKKDMGRRPAARSELGNKAPAKNTPAASSPRGRKTSKKSK